MTSKWITNQQYYYFNLYFLMNNLPAFNGLISKDMLSQEILNNIYRKVQQYQKVCTIVSDFFSVLGRQVEINYTFLTNEMIPTEEFLEADPINENTYLVQFCVILKSISNGYNKFILTYSISLKEYIEQIGSGFNEFINIHLSKSKKNLQNYKNLQQNLYEMYKKYIKCGKNVATSISNYQNAISNPKFAYNKNEKAKLFDICKKLYNEFVQLQTQMNDILQDINASKNQLILNFNFLVDKYKKFVKYINEKILFQIKKIIVRLNNLYKQIINDMSTKRKCLQKIIIKSYFCDLELFINVSEYLNVRQIKPCKYIPVFISYHKDIKQLYLLDYERWIKEYYLNIKQKYEINKKTLKIICSFFIEHIKNIEKNKSYLIKQLANSIQKFQKSICDSFGITIYQYLKGIYTILENCPNISDKVVKNINTKLTNVLYFINQDHKIGEIFFKDLYRYVNQHTAVKKKLKLQQKSEFEQLSHLNQQQIIQLKKSIHQTSQSIENLILMSNQKVEKNLKQLKSEFDSIFTFIYYSFQQNFKSTSEYHTTFFGNQFEISLDKTHFEMNQILERDKPIIDIIDQNTIIELQDSQKFNHDQFKKINQSIQITTYENITQESDSIKSKKQPLEQNIRNLVSKSQKKFYLFLKQKIVFQENQIYLNSFDCAFNDKIVLQGKIYVTNRRICFHSYFNVKNIFFGETFLEIPKKDIKKVEKRYTALIFDNSLAITTVNGQMIFTSFSKRDNAYDLIVRTFNINSDQVLLKSQNLKSSLIIQEKINDEPKNQTQQQKIHNEVSQINKYSSQNQNEPDSITQQQQKQRLKKYQHLFNKPFKHFFSLKLLNTNCIFLLRNYFGQNPITIQGKKYRSFFYYFKDVHLGQKQIKYERWNPELLQYLNQQNIKSTMPLQFKKNYQQKHPIHNSIPFMPKFCTSFQNQTLSIISKSRFIFEQIIWNKGAPLADNFRAHLRYEFINNEKNVQFLGYFYIEIIKSTIMKSIIQLQTSKEMKESAQLLCRLLNDRIKLDVPKIKKLDQINSNILVEQSKVDKNLVIENKEDNQNKQKIIIHKQQDLKQKNNNSDKIDQQQKILLNQIKQKYNKEKQKNTLFRIFLALSVLINLMALFFQIVL